MSPLIHLICFFRSDSFGVSIKEDKPLYESDTPEPCAVGIGSNCGENEVCVQLHKFSRSGYCTCMRGFSRNQAGECTVSPSNNVLSRISPLNAQFRDSQDGVEPSMKVGDLFTFSLLFFFKINCGTCIFFLMFCSDLPRLHLH